ncbi:DeoR family transcriptional regulator [Dactylosporangium sp. NPDC000244]|uniref:DeoR family transcriptional regulator n=1 Tax=Dactylosporangium sp. NPDC000244 TaxID=3154365 RepID=UPI0033322F81
MTNRGGRLPAVRRRAILDLLAEQEFVTIEQVQAATGTSSSTVQRDLGALAAAGALSRIRGGARRRSPDIAALRSALNQLRRTLDSGDLHTVERTMRWALSLCEGVRYRERWPDAGNGPGA